MNKKYTYGVAALVLTGTTLIGTSLYAADVLPKFGSALNSKSQVHMNRGSEDMLASLSGSVSPAALAEFTALMDAHKAKMDALKSTETAGTIDKTAFETLRTEHQAALTALFKKYPELETALKNQKGAKMSMGKGKGFETLSFTSTLPTEVTTKIQAIRDAYEVKHTTLRDQEDAEVLAALEAYPDAKKAFQEMLQNKPTGDKGGFNKGGMMGGKRGMGRGGHDGMNEGNTSSNSTTNSTQAAQ